MKSILLKLDDKLFNETEKQVKAENTSRLSYIKRAIEQYNAMQQKRSFEKQIEREVELIKQFDPDKELKHDLEASSLNDLQKHLND